ncbi:hypothetical protein [Thalassobellus suaedae]|uniref:Glycoside hydrolase family 28 protein n=1 Tax=Thalassobellus suaedae TaxID=3074124 RepID=A0ABY9XTA9_9FLAO|nr:hypothetical protein RHP51_19315 [Flavobacteriaceae bacterium HL-DH14]
MKNIQLHTFLVLIILAITLPISAQKNIISINETNIYEGIEFSMPKVNTTSFPDYQVSITDFGAITGGIVKNTDAFAKAINDVSIKGGGQIIVPRGIWLTGTYYI